jgi:hypothetical protein
MFAVGEMKIAGVGMSETVTTAYLSENNGLSKINRVSEEYSLANLLTVLPTMQQIESQGGCSPSNRMGGICSPYCRITVIKNLSNSTHYDVADGSVGFSI